MPIRAPSFSEGTWLGASIIVVSAIASIIGVVYLIAPSAILCLGVATGFGWALVLALLVINGNNRSHIARLETELAQSRLQANEWSSSAADMSAATKAVAELFRPQVGAVMPRRRRVAAKPKDEG
jgi:hypothetical protein